MTTDEGTPKRRRGLFRRDRGVAAATTDERRSTDAFDDPWSASAWDDWDDDFTNGGARSSVPAAAAPRPEAVDAWLQSEADDFDTAARRNTKRWGGDASRPSDTSTTGLRSLRAETESLASTEPTATVTVPGGLGLGALRDTGSTEPVPLTSAVPDFAESTAPTDDADLSNHVPADWATDPDLLAVAGPVDEATLADDAAIDDAIDEIDRHTVAFAADGAVDAVRPIWEPVDELIPEGLANSLEAASTEIADESVDDTAVDNTAVDNTAASVDGWIDAEPVIVADVDRVAPTDEADHFDLPSDVDRTGDASAESTTDDELVLTDELVPEQLDLDDLATLDEAPDVLPAPMASWAPTIASDPGLTEPPSTQDSAESERDPQVAEASEEIVAPEALTVSDDAKPGDEPFVAAEVVRVRLPGFDAPAPPPEPVAKFVTVSVVSDDDHPTSDAPLPGSPKPAEPANKATNANEWSSPPAAATTAPISSTSTPMSPPSIPALVGETAPTGQPTTDVGTSAIPTAPKITSRRWAALAAEFGSDGDLDASFPSRPRTAASAPAAVRPITAEESGVDRIPTAEQSPTVDKTPTRPTLEKIPRVEESGLGEGPNPVVDDPNPVLAAPSVAAPSVAAPPVVAPTVAASIDDLATAVAAASVAAPTDDDATADLSIAVATPSNETTKPDADPWITPPLRRARPDAAASRPSTSRGRSDGPPSSDNDPWARPPRRTERPNVPDRTEQPGSSVAAETTGSPSERRPPRSAEAVPMPPDKPRVRTTGDFHDDARLVSPDISSFAGYVGTALVGFAIVRVVLTLLDNQPVIPARYTGREASLLRIGESFGASGSAWPLALVVGTVLLVVPSFLAVRSHLRRWAPIVGLAAATGVVSIGIGALRFFAGLRLDSASTVKLVSDVVVGATGFGLLTLVAIVLAVRSHRR